MCGRRSPFIRDFPILEDAGPARSRRTSPTEVAPLGLSKTAVKVGQGGSVVIVDDDPDQRALLERWLGLVGHSVTAFNGGEACLAGLAATLPEAVCLDLHMAGLSGMETLERIQAHSPELPIIMLTGERSLEAAVSAMKLGAHDYLTKPIDRARLGTVVQNAINQYRMAVRLTQLENEVEDWPGRAILGRCGPVKELLREIDRVALSDVTVLIQGESGTGKELVARAIHERSSRREGPLVVLNCAAIPETLQESELFGHERGAFTGASQRRAGVFERAHGGTLLLDELAELSPPVQAKLLRVLQERTYMRLGGSRDLRSDFRLLAATHRDLPTEVRDGRFREDLFFRVAIYEIHVPPLRSRGEDVLLLADVFLRRQARELDRPVLRLTPEASELLLAYDWPGNVRELQNVAQRAALSASVDELRPRDLPRHLRAGQPGLWPERAVAPPRASESAESTAPFLDAESTMTLEALERAAIEAALRRTGGNVSKACSQLGIGRTTLYRRLKTYASDEISDSGSSTHATNSS